MPLEGLKKKIKEIVRYNQKRKKKERKWILRMILDFFGC
jgi:hypothetical protein